MAKERQDMQEKESLTKEDLDIATSRMDEFAKDTKNLMRAYNASTLLKVVAGLADKFSRDQNGNFSPGWFWGYVTSNLFSGTSGEILNYLIYQKKEEKTLTIHTKLHEEYDSFSIAERNARRNNTDNMRTDINSMCEAINRYWTAKGELVSTSLSAGLCVGLTLVSGGMSNLPIAGGILATAGLSSYIVNKKLIEPKRVMKDDMRKAQGEINKKNRQMDINSVEREINDPTKKEYEELTKKQNTYKKTVHSFIKLLNKYAYIGTAIKAATIAAVVAATWGNPTNLLVSTGAAFGIYAAANQFINACYTIKEQKLQFATYYKAFKRKIKDITYGKEKIPSNANTIILDKIAFKHRDEKDITKRHEKELFSTDKTINISTGITFLSGASGSGKSTLLDLLKHSDDLTRGDILIGTTDKQGQFNGSNYKELAFGQPCKHISFDIQGGCLSDLTVNEFITMANPAASPTLVTEVKKLLGINKKQNTSVQGIDEDAKIGSWNMSGGEISRLKLAQTLIKDSPIMVFDEATIGIDTAMKNNILEHINKLKDEKTIIWVTHMPDEIEALNGYQAIDLNKQKTDKPTDFEIWNTADPAIKKEYQTFFANRSKESSPSSSPHNLPEDIIDLDKIIAEASQKAEKAEKEYKKQQAMLQRANDAKQRLLEKNSSVSSSQTNTLDIISSDKNSNNISETTISHTRD